MADTPRNRTDIPTPREVLPSLQADGREFELQVEDRCWRVCALGRKSSPDTLRAKVLVERQGEADARFLGSFNLYSVERRNIYAKEAAKELCVEPQLLKPELNILVHHLDAVRKAQRRGPRRFNAPPPEPDEATRRAARDLREDPDPIQRVLEQTERGGVVGGEAVKGLVYLAAVSARLGKNIPVVFQGKRGVGKRTIRNSVLDLIPEEDILVYRTWKAFERDRAIDDPAHKIIVIEEDEGERIGQRNIETAGVLFRQSSGINLEDAASQALLLSLDESPTQIEAIHRRERRKHTPEGYLERREYEDAIPAFREFVKQLRRGPVFNPYAEELRAPTHLLREQIGEKIYNELLEANALAHQAHRPRQTLKLKNGQSVTGIVVTQEDVARVDGWLRSALPRTELPPRTQQILDRVIAYVGARAQAEDVPPGEWKFTRRDLRKALPDCGATQLKLHLKQLAELEYLQVSKGRHGVYTYKLTPQSCGEAAHSPVSADPPATEQGAPSQPAHAPPALPPPTPAAQHPVQPHPPSSEQNAAAAPPSADPGRSGSEARDPHWAATGERQAGSAPPGNPIGRSRSKCRSSADIGPKSPSYMGSSLAPVRNRPEFTQKNTAANERALSPPNPAPSPPPPVAPKRSAAPHPPGPQQRTAPISTADSAGVPAPSRSAAGTAHSLPNPTRDKGAPKWPRPL